MNSNLSIPSSIDYKHILLRKLSYAVVNSVISQFLIFIFYIFILNFRIFDLTNSLREYFATLTSLSTWIYLLLFTTIVFAQSIICAKDYIIAPKYCSTRFSKVTAVFSRHNFFLLCLHIIVGLFTVWLLLAFSSYRLLVTVNGKYYVKELALYLLYLGSWIGLFYFIRIYTSEKRILFPVVSQMKWLQFKAQLFPLLKRSKQQAFWPCVYYVCIYGFFGRTFTNYLPFNLQEENGNLKLYIFTWFFASLIYFHLNLMTFFYELFLTESLEFPIESHETNFTLKDALSTNMPVIQHLACQDLFYLAANSKSRRQTIFALSNPGNHPHNWNKLIATLLKLLKDYSNCLHQSLDNILLNEKPNNTATKPLFEVPKQEPLAYNTMTPLNRAKLRNMGVLTSPECIGLVSVKKKDYFTASKEELCLKMNEKIDKIIEGFKQKMGINFLFKELPEANIQKCLGEGQMIVWIVQSVSCLCESSKLEDRFGIVQKDLPVIISTLVDLKVALEKLNRVPALSKRGPGLDNDYNCKMKMSLINATKRSIFNIVHHFEPFLKDFNLKSDVLAQLSSFKSGNPR